MEMSPILDTGLRGQENPSVLLSPLLTFHTAAVQSYGMPEILQN